MGSVLAPAPLDLVDLFLDLERLEVIELGLVRLELGVELVFAGLFLSRAISSAKGVGGKAGVRHGSWTNCLVAFKENHTAALVTRCEIVARVVELDGGDDIGWGSLQSAQPSQRSAQATTLYWMAGKYSGSGVLLPYLL